jgi:SAM-dependent methyltransferase
MREIEKYRGLYSSSEHTSYGHTNHGAKAVKLLIKTPPTSVVDIGCGWNEFCGLVRAALPDVQCVGVDFACPGADVKAEAHELPFADKSFELLTAFDMLEHVTPDLVDKVLAEMARVSQRFLFSISYVPSKRTWLGQNLHPTVQTEEWWINRIMRAGGLKIAKWSRYITGTWGEACIIKKDTSCVLVGNGPGALMRNRGVEIDAFEEVVRFNGYAIDPWADKLGCRTTLWSTYGYEKLPQGDQRPQRVIYTFGERGAGPAYIPEQLYRIPSWFFGKIHKEVQKRAAWHTIFANEDKLPIASSGLLVTCWLLHVVGLDRVHLVGFDHFRKDISRQHHYWTAGAFSRPKDHDGEVEASMFADLVVAGRVVYL